MATRQLNRTASAMSSKFVLRPLRAQRPLSLSARCSSTIKLRELDGTQLAITNTTTPRDLLSPDKLVFGHSFTDHMLTAEWTASQGIKAFPILISILYLSLSLQDGAILESYLTKISH